MTMMTDPQNGSLTNGYVMLSQYFLVLILDVFGIVSQSVGIL